jgi:hypothetical protein
MPDVVAGFVAFVRWAFAREMGKDVQFGHDVRRRAGQALIDLKKPAKSIACRSRLVMLCRESDLFDEEHATDQVVLELQSRVIELAPANDSARRIVETMLTMPPMAALVAGTLVEAMKDGCNEIEFKLAEEDSLVTTNFRAGGDWKEAMTVPANLWKPLHGFLFRIHQVGYAKVRPYMKFPERLPSHLEFVDIADRRAHMRLSK